MKRIIPYLLATLLAGFGLLTLFLSTSVIFDLFGIRAKEGNYVLFVVWSNFISSIIYLFSAYGFVKDKKWTVTLLSISTAILFSAFIGLNIYANSGGIYETKTMSALIFRTAITFVFAVIAYFTINTIKNQQLKFMNMNTLKFIASILVISNLLMSCGNAKDNKPKEQTEAVSHEEHNHDQKSETLKLNNGEKWIVNEEMKPFTLDAEAILNQYTASRTEDYKTLATQLKEKNSGLIKSCTMKGESHDELHKWLYPHIELIEALSKAESTEEASKIIADLQASFSTFNQYFH